MTEAQGELSLTGRAIPERILDVRAQPVVTEAAADDGVVRVRGYLNYSLFYVGAGGAGPQYSEWVGVRPLKWKRIFPPRCGERAVM